MENKQPSYYDLVYAVVRQVPRGRVTTYGAIADFLALGASRMVGWALNNCHSMDNVPAHRVVNRLGELSGRHHFSPPQRMQELLQSEGVQVENDCVLGFKELLWKPADALGLDWEYQPG
jgi:methylated-DNA-protein-cysteine methyltransferase-like protein